MTLGKLSLRNYKRKRRWHNITSQRPKETSYVDLYDVHNREAKRKEASDEEASRQEALRELGPIEEAPKENEEGSEDSLQEGEEEDLEND